MKNIQRENAEKVAARLRQILNENYDGSDIKVEITYEKTGRSLLMEKGNDCDTCYTNRKGGVKGAIRRKNHEKTNGRIQEQGIHGQT